MTRSWRIPLIGAFLLSSWWSCRPRSRSTQTGCGSAKPATRTSSSRTLTAQGALGAAAMAVAFGVLLLNLRIAMRTISPRELVVNTREGPIAIAVDRRRVQPVGTAAAAVLALLFGAVRLGPVAGLAVVPSRAAVRRGGSRARQGRRLLRLPAALPGCAPRLSLRPRRAGRRHRRCGVCARWRHRLRSEPRCCESRVRRSATWPRSPPRCSLVLAFGAYLDVPRLLTTPAGIIHGAANVDVAVRIPALRVLMVAALVGRRAGAVSDGRRVLVAASSAPPPSTSS